MYTYIETTHAICDVRHHSTHCRYHHRDSDIHVQGQLTIGQG